MVIEIRDCGNCPCCDNEYCSLAAHIPGENGFHVLNEWNKNEMHEDCPLKKLTEVILIPD